MDAKLDQFRKVVEDVDGSTEGGQTTVYLEGPDILKIATVYYGETGNSTHCFYLKRGSLVFYSVMTKMYKKPLFESSKAEVKSVSVERIAFRNGNISGWFLDDKVVNGEFSNKRLEVLAFYKDVQSSINN
jgi:hypothetical protein